MRLNWIKGIEVYFLSFTILYDVFQMKKTKTITENVSETLYRVHICLERFELNTVGLKWAASRSYFAKYAFLREMCAISTTNHCQPRNRYATRGAILRQYLTLHHLNCTLCFWFYSLRRYVYVFLWQNNGMIHDVLNFISIQILRPNHSIAER